MYRFLFRPAWILFHLIVLAGVVLMANLGFWQLDRLDERKEFNTEVRERSREQPVDLASVLDDIADGTLTPDDAEWLPVTVDGTYFAAQVVEFNNSQGGRAGDNVLTALAMDTPSDSGSDTVIVNRGFIPLGFEVPPAPSVAVTVVGYVRPSEERGRGGVTDADAGGTLTEIRRIDVERLAQQYSGEVAPVFVQLIAGDPEPTVGDPEPVVLPQLDNGPHLSYAMQWFVFALCVLIGWVLAVRRSVIQHRRDAERAEAPSDDAVSEPAPA